MVPPADEAIVGETQGLLIAATDIAAAEGKLGTGCGKDALMKFGQPRTPSHAHDIGRKRGDPPQNDYFV